MSIMDFSAEAIARQMTVLDNELFQKVDVSLYLALDDCSLNWVVDSLK